MDRPQRRHTRLQKWNYSQPGTYFLTFCTHDRLPILGSVEIPSNALDEAYVLLSELGLACLRSIERISSNYHGVTVDKYVVMPNHVHVLLTTDGELQESTRLNLVSRIMASIKGPVTKVARSKSSNFKVWQSSFHDHIVRDEKDFERIYEYIETNPIKWVSDRYYTDG